MGVHRLSWRVLRIPAARRSRIGGMDDQRRMPAPAIACIAFAILVPVSYVTGYFTTCEVFGYYDPGEELIRLYPTEWLAKAYWPLTKLESRLRSNRTCASFVCGDDGAFSTVP
jgi:hypothetical protein